MIQKWASFAFPCFSVKVLKKRIIVHCEIEVVVTFDFSFALKQMQTHAFKRILAVSI